MAQAFDTLGFAKHLASAKVPQEQAEAIAEAIRDKVMIELATKADIQRLEGEVKRLADQVTIRLGGMMIVGFGIMAALLRFFASA